MILPSLSSILVLLEHYKYILIFPIAVLEGPIVTIITGLLVSLGYLNGFLAYIILAIGDVTGDVLYYWIGRLWGHSKWIKRWGKYFGYDEKSEEALENHFKKHKAKTLLLGKLAHGVGGAALFAAGIAKMNIWEFIWYNTLGTLPKTLILLLIGYYVGSSYMQIDKYLSSIALTTTSIVVLIIAYILISKFAKNYFSKEK